MKHKLSIRRKLIKVWDFVPTVPGPKPLRPRKQNPAILKARHTWRNKQHKQNAKIEGILLRKRTAIHKHRNRHLFRAHRLLSSVNKQ